MSGEANPEKELPYNYRFQETVRSAFRQRETRATVEKYHVPQVDISQNTITMTREMHK